MKKLFFAAIAAIVMVSVSNVFANNAKTNVSFSMSDDTTTVDSIQQPSELPAETPVETPVDTTVNDSAESQETAMLMFSDSTEVDTTSTDSTTVPASDVA